MNGSVKQPRVAVLDDDADLRKLLRFILRKDFEVVLATNGTELRRLVDEGTLDVIVLDIGLPDEDGISIAQKIRLTSAVPIIFLSGYSSEEMIVKGLNIGGDDYVTKPFQPEVLLARVRNALRRAVEQQPVQPVRWVQLGDVVFDVREQVLSGTDGRSVKLTDMEARILSALAAAENRTLSRDEMFRRIYGRDWDLSNRGLEVHLSHLRKKLTEATGTENPIAGIRGLGYRLTLEQAQSQG